MVKSHVLNQICTRNIKTDLKTVMLLTQLKTVPVSAICIMTIKILTNAHLRSRQFTITMNFELTSQLDTTQQFTELFVVEKYNLDLSKTYFFCLNN